MKALFAAAILILFCCFATRVAASSAYLQPPGIYAGDVTELVIEYDSRVPALYELDTAALEAEFDLLATQSRVIRLHNTGEASHRMQWKLKIAPRRAGNLVVPSVHFGFTGTWYCQLMFKPPKKLD